MILSSVLYNLEHASELIFPKEYSDQQHQKPWKNQRICNEQIKIFPASYADDTTDQLMHM
jgi:hypothetical protein